mgnify:CR=1 FL=1
MDFQTILNFTLGTVSAVLGWFARELWDAIKELKADLAKLREELPKEYTRKEDFQDFRKEIIEYLQRIEDKIDTKVDKR